VGRLPADDAGWVVLQALPSGLDEQSLCVGHEGAVALDEVMELCQTVTVGIP
jgi:hypothetical protein